MFDYLPEHQRYRADGKDKITIEHLLTMTSGLAWKEWGASNTGLESDLFKLWVACDDQVACVLEKPLVHEPGTASNYTGGGMTVLGEIIKNTTDMDIEAFCGRYLFEPLGTDPIEWRRYDSGVIHASGEQQMMPREMLKFGLLYLNNGVWNGGQIIPQPWVERSATPYAGNQGIKIPGEYTGRAGYSCSWWTKQHSNAGETVNTSWAGTCGLRLPRGFDGAGLPIGLQVMGPALGEGQMLRIAYAYEQATDWHTRKPPLHEELV